MTAMDSAPQPAPDNIENALASPFRTDRDGLSRERGFDSIVERLSEGLNPILVKEARQALKSRQFVVTFTLLLSCGWAWSLLGVALASPGIYHAPGGSFMLIGYYFVLIAPMLIVVPFSAFRSLAAEREDGTFELLSITSLGSRQIVTGKLGSAILQMMVYYSALAPCIAFTYLLRGIDIFTIGFVLFYTFLTSVLLSTLGLVVATVTRARHLQVLLSVLLLLALMAATLAWVIAAWNIILASGTMPYRSLDFWTANLAVVSFCISFAVMFVLIAASLISFASDNRSTRLRVIMMVQQVLWIGWMTYCWLRAEDDDVLIMFMVFPAMYWYLAGALLTSEVARLSPRVKRSLPQSFLGRIMLTWFNPGSGTGYMFAVTNLATVFMVVAGLGIGAQMTASPGSPRGADWLVFGLMATCYVVNYLGIGRLIVLAIRQFAYVGMLVPFLISIFVAFMGCVIPFLLEAWWVGFRGLSYSAFQAPNWVWTLGEAGAGNLASMPAVPIMVASSAAVVFGLNLIFAIYEVEHVRLATPQRVLDDENERVASTSDKVSGNQAVSGDDA